MNREEIIKKALLLRGAYMNCRLFVQNLVGISDLQSLEISKKINVGNILQFGKNPSRHWAIYIGDGEVIEVSEWGDDPKIDILSNLVKEYGKPIVRVVKK